MKLSLPVEIHRKAYRRTLKIRLNPSGAIEVFCGQKTKEEDIRRFLEQAKPFLKRSYKRLFQIKTQLPHPFSDVDPWIPWLGERLTIEVDDSLSVPRIEAPRLSLARKHRHLKAIQSLYKNKAETIILPRVSLWATTMGLHPKKVALRGQKSRWGSCSAQGAINLNWKILIAPLEVIDYLIVHELAHLKHRNHGAGFWTLVEKYQPDYKLHEKWLRTHQHLAEFLDEDSAFYKTAVDAKSIEKLFDL